MSSSLSTTPLFIPSESGALFALHIGQSAPLSKKCIVHLPAFAEEMNKSRRMVALQARAFTEQGYSVLVFDLFGTGDSQGEFAEATWAGWLRDVGVVIAWLRKQGVESISFWGLRSGVLLGLDFMRQSEQEIDHFIAWQPVLNGEKFVMQFLRLRVAAAMMDKGAPQEKVSDLKRLLASGEGVEVAGYYLNPELVNPLMALKVSLFDSLNAVSISLFELTADSDGGGSRGCLKWVEQLKQQGKSVSLMLLEASPFWSTQEIVEVPELVERTSHSLNLEG